MAMVHIFQFNVLRCCGGRKQTEREREREREKIREVETEEATSFLFLRDSLLRPGKKI